MGGILDDITGHAAHVLHVPPVPAATGPAAEPRPDEPLFTPEELAANRATHAAGLVAPGRGDWYPYGSRVVWPAWIQGPEVRDRSAALEALVAWRNAHPNTGDVLLLLMVEPVGAVVFGARSSDPELDRLAMALYDGAHPVQDQTPVTILQIRT